MIRVHTLGTSLICAGEHRFTPASPKRFAFLLYLAAEPGRHHPRSILSSLFFSDISEKQAKQRIRERVYELRQFGVVFETDSHGIHIPPTEVWRDWDEPLTEKPVDDATIRLIEGGFLPGCEPDITEEYRAWFGGFRGTVVSDLAKAMVREVDRAKVTANWKRVERAARACVAVDPLNSKATEALAEMLAIGGSTARAAELIATYKAEMRDHAAGLSVSLKSVRRLAQVAQQVDARNPSERFAGRDAEMKLLTNAFGEIQRGGANVIVLRGEPGIGKSRLLSELAVYVALESGAPIATAAHPHDTGMPLTVIRNLSKALMDQPGALGCSPASMDWVRRLIKPEGAGPFASAEATSTAISSAVIDLVNAVSGETPLVLMVDDAQWADRASLELLQSIAVSPATKDVLIVFGARDAHRIFELGYWGTRFAVAEVAPLDGANAIALVTEQLGEGDSEHRSLIAWMAELAGGNPFFLETIVGHYRATNERFSVPLQVNAVVDQRIRALTREAREVLEAIVVLGRHATIARLEQVLDAAGPVLIRATRELEQQRLIVVSDRVMPSHWLITESVEHHASPIARRMLCRRVATILEREVAPLNDSSAFLDCAELWVAAGEAGRAAELIASCARGSLTIGRVREAAALFLRAAGYASGHRREELATLCIRVASLAGESDLTLQAATMVPNDAHRGHDDVELAVLAARSRMDLDVECTLRSLRACIGAASASNGHRLSAAISFLIFCDQNRHVEQILEMRPLFMELLDQTADDEPQRLQCGLVYHATFGDLARVPSICEQLLEIAANSRADTACDLVRKASVGLYRCGRDDQALVLLERCYSLATNTGQSRVADASALMLADQYLNSGAIDSALKWFAIVSTIPPGAHDEYVEFSRLSIETDFAIWRRDPSALLQLADLAHGVLRERRTKGATRLYTAARLAAAHFAGDEVDADAPEQLTAHHVPGYELGELSDFEIAVATSILREKRGDVQAKQALLDYLERVRRPGPRPSLTLVNESLSLGVDAQAILENRLGAAMSKSSRV